MPFANKSVIKKILALYKEKRFLHLKKKEKDVAKFFESALTKERIEQVRNNIKSKYE